MKFIKLSTPNIIAVSEISSLEYEFGAPDRHLIMAYKKSGSQVLLGQYESIDDCDIVMNNVIYDLNKKDEEEKS